MKNFILTALAVIFISCNQNNTEEIVQPEIKFDRELELEKLRYLKEVEWPKAYREQDTVLLDRILGDDFQMVTNTGVWSNKKEQIELIKSEAMNHDSFKYEIKRLEILENGTAIIAGTGHIMNDSIKTIYQSSNVLELRDGIWKAVLSHVSGVRNLE